MKIITKLSPDLHNKKILFTFAGNKHEGIIWYNEDGYFVLSKTTQMAGSCPRELPEGYTVNDSWQIGDSYDLDPRNYTPSLRDIHLIDSEPLVILNFPTE